MKLRESLPLKITAVVLSVITVMLVIASVISIAYIFDRGFYINSRQEVRNAVLSDKAYSEVYNVYDEYDWDGKPKDYADRRGIYYTITSSKTGEILETNYSGEDYLVSKTVRDFETYELISEPYEQRYEEVKGGEVDITVYIPNTTKLSLYNRTILKITDIMYTLRFSIYWIGSIALIITIICFCYLCAAAGHRKGGVITTNLSDKIPFDFVTAAVFATATLSIILISECINTMNFLPGVVVFALIIVADYLIALWYILTFATRVKTSTLIKNNILYKLFFFIKKHIKKLFAFLRFEFKNIPLVWRTVIVVLAVSFLWMLLIIRSYYDAEAKLFTFVFLCLFSFVAVFLAITLQRIKKGGERIASGDLEHKIDTKYLYGDFKDFAESLNNINDGLAVAVNERMKSERFKTELITNVSHDIKTPLTSIINYVDLIKKEKPENEKIVEYIAVLDRQSSRLKKLIEDLVEASKASTGNLTVNLTECEVGVLLSQTVGEFDEKLKSTGLNVVLKQPEEPVKILADGRHLWRVFDNLMNNICKYSLRGTRVYLEVSKNVGSAVITFRNISAFELNISSEELMERFVRGDKSRGTEGSGLGLSIARSLTELQKGTLDISVDGDLFKVTLTFPTI